MDVGVITPDQKLFYSRCLLRALLQYKNRLDESLTFNCGGEFCLQLQLRSH